MLRIRPVRADECDVLLGLIRELADFERLSDQVVTTPEQLHAHLFGPRPCAESVFAEVASPAAGAATAEAGSPETGAGPTGVGPMGVGEAEVVGFALYFFNFSTFLGQPGLYLEDLFVRPAHRRRGIGRALIRHLAGIADQRGCGRMEWSVLDWNQNAIAFYRGLGADVLPDWRTTRLTAGGIRRLAAED